MNGWSKEGELLRRIESGCRRWPDWRRRFCGASRGVDWLGSETLDSSASTYIVIWKGIIIRLRLRIRLHVLLIELLSPHRDGDLHLKPCVFLKSVRLTICVQHVQLNTCVSF